jgi:hypothetical protein
MGGSSGNSQSGASPEVLLHEGATACQHHTPSALPTGQAGTTAHKTPATTTRAAPKGASTDVHGATHAVVRASRR